MRPFRVVWVDDEVYTALMRSEASSLRSANSSTTALGILGRLLRVIDELSANGARHQIEAFLASSLSSQANVQAVWPENAEWKSEYRKDADVLILDIGEVGPLDPNDRLIGSDLKGNGIASEEDARRLNSEYPGAAFYLKNRKQLSRCQAVIIMTAYDRMSPATSSRDRSLVEQYLDPCCCPDSQDESPYTIKHPSSETGYATVEDIITSLYADYCDGYTRLTHRDAIEFAATHDLPVLIIGETGTGKEYIAKAIHRRWVQEQRRFGRQPSEELQIVNCAGLTEQLARIELFGHVRGSFTGADDHRLGVILKACGANEIPTQQPMPRGGWATEYEQNFRRVNRNLLANPQAPGLVLNAGEEPKGTIFLDEFGDLPLSVQTLLLRYFETAEVPPLGYPGRIQKAKTRVIVATSDPRIAEFAGVSLPGSWRSKEEQARPFRDDLLHRLRGQTIQAEPVTTENVRAIFSDMLNRRTGNQPPEWNSKAIDEVCNTIGSLLNERVTSGESGLQKRFVFGHLRELSRIIELADVYVLQAARRGLRGVGGTVTDGVVKRVWRPSELVGAVMGPAERRSPGSDSASVVSMNSTNEAIQSHAPITLANLAEKLAKVSISWKDDALRGAHTRLVKAFEDLLKRVIGAGLKRCDDGANMAKLARLLTGEDSAKSDKGIRMLYEALNLTQQNRVDEDVVKTLLDAWKAGAGGES